MKRATARVLCPDRRRAFFKLRLVSAAGALAPAAASGLSVFVSYGNGLVAP